MRAPAFLAFLLLPLAVAAQDSPLFQGTTADMWLADPDTDQVTGYNTCRWMQGIDPAEFAAKIDFNDDTLFLINNLANSSMRMTMGQPVMSLVGIGDRALLAGEGGRGGHRDLTLMPASGTYTNTIAVVMAVSGSILAQDEHRLSWTVTETASGTIIINDSVVIPKGGGGIGENGFHTETFYLANDGDFAVAVRLRGTAIDTTANANYDLVIDPADLRRDTDGDGIPDMVEVDMGLNPFEDDWMADTDGNGWTEFDEWLRRYCLDPVTRMPLDVGPECLDADGVPLDTDLDYWTDFDEILRGTNHLDPEPTIVEQSSAPPANQSFSSKLALADPEYTEYEAQQRLRFKDFPAASRLYEVEHLVQPGAGVMSVPPLASILIDQAAVGTNDVGYPGIVVQSYTAGQDNIAGIDIRVAAGGDGVEDIYFNIWADSLRDGTLLLAHKIEDVLLDGDPDQPIIVRFEPVAVQPGQTIYFEFRKQQAALVATEADTLGGGGVVEINGVADAGNTDLVFDVYYDASYANGIGGTRAAFQWWTVGAANLEGTIAYDPTLLLRDSDITAAGLATADIAPRRRMLELINAFGGNKLPEMRLPAGDSLIVSAVHRHQLPAVQGGAYRAPADYSRVYKRWLTRSDDITPQAMLAELGEGSWTTPDEWRREFVAYLLPRVVVPVALTLDEASTLEVAIVEAALSEEARLDGSGGLQVINGIFQPGQPVWNFQPGQALLGDLLSHQSPYISDWEANLERLATSDFNLDGSVAEVSAALGPGGALEPLGQWLRGKFYAGVPGTSSDAYMAGEVLIAFPDVCKVPTEDIAARQADIDGWNEFLNQCPAWVDDAEAAVLFDEQRNRCYLVRLNLLPGATTEINADASLLDLSADSDVDGAMNGNEVETSIEQLTLPWMFDTDGDGIADFVDQCPNDPFNDCSANPITPNVTISADFAVFEPETGSDFALVSIQLDRIYDVPVTVCYEAIMNLGDTATPDVDFDAVTGCVTIEPGKKSALIRIPINADTELDGGETFTVRITSVTNGTIADDGEVVVTVNDPIPTDNAAPVFTSANAVSVAEGGLDTGYTASAIDADGDTLTFSISGGADAAEFSIDPATGILSFVTPPDFDTPADANGDNDYEVQLTVDDGNGGSDTLDLVVTVVELGLFVEVSYPTPGANLGGAVTMTTVTGNVVDPLGAPIDPADIVFIGVNAVTATLDPGDPSRWSVQVPVSAGPNTLSVLFERIDGASQEINVDVQNFQILWSMFDIGLDAANNRLVVQDTYHDGLYAVDLTTGLRTPISVNFDGDIPNFGCTAGFTLDLPNNRALVTDPCGDALFEVDLTTGDREYISRDGFVGAGPTLAGANNVAVDSANNRALVSDTLLEAIFAVDLTSGDRSILSDPGTGSGPNFLNANKLVLDSPNNRVLVVDPTLDAIVAVDLTSGDRSIVSDNGTGTGPTFSVPQGLGLDAANNRAFVADQVRGLLEVDLATGDRTLVDAPSADYGLNASRIHHVALDLVSGTAYVADSRNDSVFAIELATGNRTVVSDSATGTVSELAVFWGITGIDYDSETRQLLLSDFDRDVLWTLDTTTVHRSLLSGPGIGTGPFVDFPGKLDTDGDNGIAYYIEQNRDDLMSVDLATGDRLEVSGASVGAGPAFAQALDVALDVAAGRALVTDGLSDALFLVDLASGDRTLVSDAVTGAGPVFTYPDSVAYDAANDRAIIMDWDSDILFGVDLTTGDRTPISDNTGNGTGNTFSIPFDLALDSDNNRALVTDYGRDTLTAIDLSTGDRTQLVTFGSTEGIHLLNPYYLTLDADNNRVFIYDLILTAIIVVELSSGEIAVAAK